MAESIFFKCHNSLFISDIDYTFRVLSKCLISELLLGFSVLLYPMLVIFSPHTQNMFLCWGIPAYLSCGLFVRGKHMFDQKELHTSQAG